MLPLTQIIFVLFKKKLVNIIGENCFQYPKKALEHPIF